MTGPLRAAPRISKASTQLTTPVTIPPSASGQNLMGLSSLSHRLASPGAAIGLALLVLAWAERNRALLVLTLCYLAVVLVPITFGWVIPTPPWHFLPQLVIDGSMLLLGGIGFALAQRPLRSPGP